MDKAAAMGLNVKTASSSVSIEEAGAIQESYQDMYQQTVKSFKSHRAEEPEMLQPQRRFKVKMLKLKN